MSVFGKAKFGGNKRNWWKLKDGENGPYRILPPMGDLQEEGRWSFFYDIHYGYKNTKNELRTFQSPLVKDRKTKEVTSPDAALDRITQLKALLEKSKKEGDEKQVAKLLELVGGKKSRYNLDKNHYMNVVDLQGNVGILKIRHRARLALMAVIDKLRSNGVEPLDPETGRYFTFTRSGMGQETVYQVNVYKKKLTVEGVGEVEQDLVHVITKELADRCVVEKADGTFTYKEAARLDRLFAKPTSEEVAKIVELGAPAVDAILDSKGTVADQDDSGLEDDETPATPAAPAATTPTADPELANRLATAEAAAKAQANAKAVAEAAKASEEAKAEATVKAAAAEVKAAAAEAKTATPAKAAAHKTTAQTVTEQSDEDFLKTLGL